MINEPPGRVKPSRAGFAAESCRLGLQFRAAFTVKPDGAERGLKLHRCVICAPEASVERGE
jgi:hypothetical protein